MGSAILDFGKAAIKSIGGAIGHSGAADDIAKEVESGVYHGVFNANKSFAGHPLTEQLWKDYTGPFHQLQSKYETEATNIATGKAPAAGKHANITVGMPHEEIAGHSKRLAMSEVFGPKREVIQGVLRTVQKQDKLKADSVANALQILFKEPLQEVGYGKYASKFSQDMASGGKEFAIDVPESKYKPTTQTEKFMRQWQRTMAWKAAIPHSVTGPMNIVMSDGLATLAKSLYKTFGPGAKSAEAMLLAGNHIPEVVFSAYKEKQMFDRGLIKQFTPGSVGEFIHKNIFMPGMDSVRHNTIVMSAHASKIAADEAVEHLMRGNLKKAVPILDELRLDYKKIQAQGGKLLPEDIEKIYYHGIDTRAFLNQGDKRNVMWQRSPGFRLAGAFHTFITAQSQFFRNTFRRQWMQGDFVGIARNLATLGLALPNVGILIYQSERFLRGQDWDHPIDHLAAREEATPLGMGIDTLLGREKARSNAAIAMNTIESLAHIAAFGVATGFINGAFRSHLANQMIGPQANMAVQGVEDTTKLLHIDENHKDAWKPLARDILQAFPSMGVGQVVANHLLKSKKEEAKSKYHKYRKPRAKKQSSNPFNVNIDY